MKIFLDDVRQPEHCVSYMYKRIGAKTLEYGEEWVVVRNYDQFVMIIENNYKRIETISFDHDLADNHYTGDSPDYNKLEKTGYHCAVWLKEFYKQKNMPLPTMYVHSMNPVGTENIINVFK